jgi:hypothetical protein
MATKPFDQEALNRLNSSIGEVESSLRGSKTAYTSNVDPTGEDLSQEAQLRSLQNRAAQLESQGLREKWYGESKDENSAVSGTQAGLLERGLNALSAPLYAVVGGVEAVLGKGTKPGFSNIAENIREKGTFGDLLQQYGAPNTGLGKWAITAPLGFALDVAADPVNWVTAGTTAFLPRIGYGLAKGTTKGGLSLGIQAAKEGALSKLSSSGSTLLGISTGIAKAGEKVAGVGPAKNIIGKKLSTKIAGMADSLGEVAANRAMLYDEMVGRNILDIIENPNKIRIGELFKEGFSKIPYGDDLARVLIYDPAEWFRVAKIKDLADKIMDVERMGGDFVALKVLKGVDREEALKNILTKFEESVPESVFIKNLKEAKELGEDMTQSWTSFDNIENAQRMLGEAGIETLLDDVKKAFEKLDVNKTGVKWYDNSMSKLKEFKIKNVAVAAKILNTYETFMDLFKASKIGASPVAWMNAIVGNLTMAGMAGVDITNPAHYKYVLNAKKLLSGNQSPEFIFKELIGNPEWAAFMKEFPGIFEKTFGFKPGFLDDTIKRIKPGIKRKPTTSPIELTENLYEDLAKLKEVTKSQLGTSIGANELISNKQTAKLKKVLREKAAEGNIPAKIGDVLFNKSMNAYERIDQANKLGVALRFSNSGVSESELMKLSRIIKMSKDDVVKVRSKSGFLFRIKPERATELANEIYMNYAAMPGAVKVLRNMPILGSPFSSFLYAMLGKTAKTVAYNPAIFNKVNFLLSEVSGSKSPIEKEALQSQYYQWLNTPGMVRLPFLVKNPIYVNFANMIPYYTMNMFTPSERKYKDTLPGEIIKLVDKSPFFKDPVGQVMFDYLVQPYLISASKDPSLSAQSSFGQPIYPINATAKEKAFYAARTLAEAPMPGVAAYLGLAQGALLPGMSEYAPSYRWRQIANAVQGKNQLGITTKESAASRLNRSLLGSVGIPVQSLDLTFLSNQINKK